MDFERPVPTFHLLVGFASSLAVRRQRTLNLSGNRLERVWAGTFVALSSLSSVDLSRNRLARLPEATFGQSPSLRRVIVEDNRPASLPRSRARYYDNLETAVTGQRRTGLTIIRKKSRTGKDAPEMTNAHVYADRLPEIGLILM